MTVPPICSIVEPPFATNIVFETRTYTHSLPLSDVCCECDKRDVDNAFTPTCSQCSICHLTLLSNVATFTSSLMVQCSVGGKCSQKKIFCAHLLNVRFESCSHAKCIACKIWALRGFFLTLCALCIVHCVAGEMSLRVTL